MWVVHLKIWHNDRDGERHSEHPAQRAQSTHKHAQVGLGHHVAVAHRGHSDQGPPQAQRDGVEIIVGVGLNPFGVIDEAGEDDDAEHQEEDEQHQLFGRGAERLEQDLQSGRVAGQLEQPQDPDDGEELQDVRVLQVGGHLSKHQVNVETGTVKKRRHFENCDLKRQTFVMKTIYTGQEIVTKWRFTYVL